VVDTKSWKDEYFEFLTNGFNEKAESILCNNIPKMLYKYFNITEYTIDNLKNDTLWFSNPQFYNDPYDSLIQRYFSFGKFLIENDIMALLTSKMSIDHSYLINLKNRLFTNTRSIKEVVSDFLSYLHQLNNCVSDQDKSSVYSLIRKIECMRIGIYDDKIFNSFFEKLYISCFSELKDNILMWSHYANSCSGFCVEYDIDNFIKTVEVEDTHIVPVIYRPDLFSYRKYSNCASPIPQIIVKNKSWEYENEWRMTSCGNPGQKGIKKHSPKITKIILGSNFNYSENNPIKDELMMLVKDRNIDLYRMSPEENTYRLNEYPVRLST
jgi:hypothetical protein